MRPDIEVIDLEQEEHQEPEVVDLEQEQHQEPEVVDLEQETAKDQDLEEASNTTPVIEVDDDDNYDPELPVLIENFWLTYSDHNYDKANPLDRVNHPCEGPFPVIGGLDEEGNICSQWMPDGYGPPYEPGSQAALQAAAEEAEAQAQVQAKAKAEASAQSLEQFPVFMEAQHPVVNYLELEYDQSLLIPLQQQEVVAPIQYVSSAGSSEAPLAQAVPANEAQKQMESYLLDVIATATQLLQKKTGPVTMGKIDEMLRDFEVKKINLSARLNSSCDPASTSASGELKHPIAQSSDASSSAETSGSSSPPAKKAKKLEGKTKEGELRITAVSTEVPPFAPPLVNEFPAASHIIIDSLEPSPIDASNDDEPTITDAPVAMVSGQDSTTASSLNLDSQSNAAINENLAAEPPIVPPTSAQSATASLTTSVTDEALPEVDSDMDEESPQDAYRRSQCARYIQLTKDFPNLIFTEEEKQCVAFWNARKWRKFMKPSDANKSITEAQFKDFLNAKRNLDKQITMELRKRKNPQMAGPSSDGVGEGPSPKRNRTNSEEDDGNHGNMIPPDFDTDIPATNDQLAPQLPTNQTTGSSPEVALEPCYVCREMVRFTGVGRLGCQTTECIVERYDHYVFFETKVSENGKKRGEQPKTIQYCQKCVSEKKFLTRLMKAAGAELIHNTKEEEKILKCKTVGCTSRAHEKCVSAYEFSDDFVCGPCLEDTGREPTREAKATDINHTAMSRNGETFLRKRFPEIDVRLRELNRSQAIAKIHKTCPEMYEKHFGHMKQKTVTSRTLGAFQRNGGKDGLIGALFVDEYSKIDGKNWVVIKYLDTVRPYSKEETEADEKKWAELEARGGIAKLGEKKISKSGLVGQDLVEWYIGYSRDRGYTHAHLWAKAEEQGSDDCFYLHPEHQVYATQDKLVRSCRRLFQKMKDNGEIKDFHSFRDRKPEINTIADIKKLDAFPHSLWSLMMNWAASSTTKLRSAEKRDARFLTALHGYMDKHMDDNFVIELNPGANKPDPVVEKDLMLVEIAKKPKKLCRFLHARRMGSNTLRDQQAATGAIIVEVVTVQDELAKVVVQQQRAVVQDDVMEVDQVVENAE